MIRAYVALLLILPATTTVALAQHQQQQGHGAMTPPATPWKELNTVHSFVHLSHHASMMNKDLGPTRNSAQAMTDAAEVWLKSAAPTECPPPADFTAKLEGFLDQTRALAELVKNQAADPEVKAALDRVHDTFRELHRVCPPSGGHKH